MDLELNLQHRNSHRKMAALQHLHHLCSAHASLGTGLEKESPAKQRFVSLFHLLSSSKWSICVGAHGPEPASGWFPCSLHFLLWPWAAAEVGRKEKWQGHDCFVAFSYLTQRRDCHLINQEADKPLPKMAFNPQQRKPVLSYWGWKLPSTVITPMKMFSVSSKRKDGRDTWN